MSRKGGGLLAVLLVLFPVLALAGVQQGEPGKKYALLIGINTYRHANFGQLQFAENDAKELGDELKRHGYTVTVLTGKDATLKNVQDHLAKIAAGKGRDDLVLVAAAGHGLLFGADSYFCVYDAEPKQKETMVALAKVYEALGDCGAGVKLLLVDACREVGVRGGRARGIDHVPAAPRGVGVLFSCSEGQYAFEHPDYKHGIFFYHVLQAFKGDKKALNDDGEVTWDLLRAYVKAQVPKAVKQLFAAAVQIPNAVENLGHVPALTRVGMADEEARKLKAKIRVILPNGAENAKVIFGGQPTTQLGLDRTYESPPLEPGKSYFYETKASWTDAGREVNRQSKVNVKAGETCTVDFTKAADADDDKKFQGTWKLVSGYVDGQKVPTDTISKMVMVFKDNTCAIKIDDVVHGGGTFTLKPGVNPKQFDMVHDTGPNKGKTDIIIYVLDGDTLKFAGYTGDNSLTKRPSTFPKDDEKGYDIFTLKRVTP